MNFLFPLEDKSGEYIGRYSAYYSLSVCVVILPGLMVFIMFQSFDKLKEPEFQKTWGSLYQGIQLDSKWQVACNLVFMFRRMFFITICFNLAQIPGVQIILVNLSNLASCVYYGKVKPFQTRFQTYLNLFNELLVTIVTWHMMLFTDFVPDQDIQYMLGWSMIIVICLNGLVNIVIILGIVGKQLFLIILKGYIILDHKFGNCCLRLFPKKNLPEIYNI